MARTDLYSAVHAGTRGLLDRARERARLAHPSPAADPALAITVLRRADHLLRAEAQRHDDHVLPHLARLAPVLAAELETRYDRCEGLARELASLCDRLAQANPREQASLASRIERALGLFAAEHLARIELEAGQAAPVLAERLSAEELSDLERELDASLTDGERGERQELLSCAADTDVPALGREGRGA